MKDQLYEVEPIKSENEHEEPNLIGFSNLQYTKFRTLQLIISSLTSIAMLQNLRSWRWIQTCSIWHYPSTTCMNVCGQQSKKSGTLCEVETIRIKFQPNQQQVSSLVLAMLSISTINENLAYSEKNSVAQETICLCSGKNCCYDSIK